MGCIAVNYWNCVFIITVLLVILHVVICDDDDDADINLRRRPTPNKGNKHLLLQMQQAIRRHEEGKRQRLRSCTSLEDASPTQVHTTHRAVARSKRAVELTSNHLLQNNNSDHQHHPYLDTFGLNDHRKSVYFNGNGVALKWTGLRSFGDFNVNDGGSGNYQQQVVVNQIPSGNFTVDIWVKPEGGQNSPVQVFALQDSCSTRTDVPNFFWAVGIEAEDPELEDQKASFSFSIRSHKSYRPSKVVDIRKYIPNVWVHLAVTYDGSMTKLYINGAKVGKTDSTWGELFTQEITSCLQLVIGGNTKSQKYFRGEIGYVSLINTPLSHHEVVKSMLRTKIRDDIIMLDNFNDLNQWEAALEMFPKHIPSTFLSDWLMHDIGLTIPQCGQTVCDDPEVTIAYQNNPKLRSYKVVRSRVINLAFDDGSNPLVQREQIKLQSEVLRKAFKPYNISITLDEVVVRNTVLRRKKILFGCEAEKIGDGNCNSECKHQLTGNDGGDCDTDFLECDLDKIGNGDCDLECNNYDNEWDGGDCCLVDAAHELTCFDPQSPNRIYMSLNEYKESLGFENTKHLNIYFADWTMDGLVGLATFPWEHEVHTKIGGVVLKPQQFGLPGATNNLVHEIGHILGLWHTHHGISEMDCTDACLEVEPSLELGDLCSDTNPTNENRECSDPQVEHFTCAVNKIKKTNFKNYMGYGRDECTDYFSPQQAARMHCYLDLIHKPWLDNEIPAPVPLPPRILTTTSNSLTLAWVAPLSHGANDNELCNQCEEDLSLMQYATQAWSPDSANTTGYFSAMHATGPPDSAQCEADPNAWLANPCDNECYLDVFFQEPVRAKKIYLWINWNPTEGIDDLVLYDKEGQSVHLGKVSAFCDMPFTMDVYDDIQIRKIRIHTNPYVSVDAVAIQSYANHPKCQSCDQISYKIKREPAFPDGEHTVIVNEKYFRDTNVIKYRSYKYSITTLLSGKASLPSPSLTHLHGGAYCGDGKLGDEESCDDGNLRDGDGCSLNCKIEKFFHCTGVPSLCYKHIGDGVCEYFEERTSVKDCGFFTPNNYRDQWAVEVQSDPWSYSEECPVEVIVGPPPVVQECKPDFDRVASWHPCGTFYQEEEYWVKAYFDRAVVAVGVVIYLGSDGMTEFNMEMNKMIVSLIDEHDQTHDGGKTEVVIACRNNPIHVNLKHDLTMAFFYTKGIMIRFQNPDIAIAAVRLRHYDYLDPKELKMCERRGKLYNTKTGLCSEHPCSLPDCEPYKIKHGTEVCTGFSEGDVCEVKCDRGYLLNSYKDEVMCFNGQWNEYIACKPIPCEPPQIPFAKIKCLDGYIYGAKCKFECKDPAIKRGKDTVIECGWEGSWSLPEAYCDIMCDKPTIKGGTLITQACNATQLPVGTKCEAECIEGYTFTQDEWSFNELTCTDEGVWAGPQCERVKCQPPDDLYHGLYSCSDAFYYNSQCTLKCPGPTGAISNITCTDTGDWSDEFSPCKFSDGTCQDVTPLEQYSLNCDGAEIGSKCTVRCNAIENEAVAIVMSAIEGKTSLINVHSILCTGRLVWHPEPLEVHCIRSCDKSFIGDGYCDGGNNRELCGYDGGDCCSSTVLGGVVTPFPLECSAKCVCKDPEAEENKTRNREENMIIRQRRVRGRGKRDEDVGQSHRRRNLYSKWSQLYHKIVSGGL